MHSACTYCSHDCILKCVWGGGLVGVMDRESTTTSLGELGLWEPNEGPFQ